MGTRAVSVVVLVLASLVLSPAEAKPKASSKPTKKTAKPAKKATAKKTAAKKAASDKPSPVDQARAKHQAADKAAQKAEAATAPLREALKKADAAYAKARKEANAKRRKADTTKKLAGEQGVKDLKRAESDAAAAAKALDAATKATPPLDKALAEARKAARPLREACQAAEKAARQAEAAAQSAANEVNNLNIEANRAVAQLAAKRRAVAAAKAALVRAQDFQKNAKGTEKATSEAAAQRKAAERALAAAEKAASAAAKLAETKKQAAAQAAAKREALANARTALAQAHKAEKDAQSRAGAAATKLAEARAQKKSADAALAKTKKKVAVATTASESAEKAAREAAAKPKKTTTAATQPAKGKKQATNAAAAKRKAADAAKNALATARQELKKAQARVTEAQKKLAQAQTQKESADKAVAHAKSKVSAAAKANQEARKVAGDLAQLDEAYRKAAAEAAAKRKAANAAQAALAPKQKALEQAAIKANAAAQNLARAKKRKESTENALASLKKRIAAAKKTHAADEKAAKEAEAAASPLKEKADKARAAYLRARNSANEKRALARKAKAELYRLASAQRIEAVMECAAPPKPANRIDDIVLAKLKSLGIKPAVCSDAVFIRRAFLDLTGTLPTAHEARTFIRSSDKNKRVALVDRLLDRTTHFDYWAMKWSDILRVKAEFPVKVWPNAAQAYHRWIWQSIAQNKPYDQFARELLTSSGSNFRVGPVNFYRAIQSKTPEGIAAAVALAFMGSRIHSWPEDRQDGMAVFFSQVGYKPTSEWKEEIVFWDPLGSTKVPGSTAPGTDAVAKSVAVTNQIPRELDKPLNKNGPLKAVFPDGTKTTIPPDRDPREVFADWLIRSDNPWFAKAIANRTWAWLMGRGIVHEPDDIRNDNPPSNPELLAYLAKELVSSGYDLRHLKRLILTSTIYQLSPIPRSKESKTRTPFASYRLRRVEAEVLIDALNQITGSSDLYSSAVPEPFTYIPGDMTAVELADGSVTSSTLALFGRSARATGMENERVNELASRQWLYILNSAELQHKLQTGPKLKALIASGGKPSAIAERLYLTILSRFPSEADVEAAEEYVKAGVAKGRDAWLDLAWALINSPEFLLRH